MKILKGLCAAAITFIPATSIAAADLLPAMTAATDGGSPVNSYAPQGYAERGRLMIADGNYRGAVDQLRRDIALTVAESATPEHEAAEYYLAVAAAHVPGEDAAGMFSAFLEKYPASLYRERALLGLAGVLYDQRNFVGALEIYQSVNNDALNPSDSEEKTLNEAYCLLQFARYDEAKQLYNTLLSTPQSNSAKFYLAYIDYVKGNYSTALDGFKKVTIDDTDPACRTPYYLAQLYYRLGDYKQALAQSRKLLAGNCPAEYLPETQRIAGESLYELGNVGEAIPLLNSYVSATENPQPSALYILGVDAYNKGNYAKAQSLLKPVVEQNNAMGQSAYLYVGQCYIQEGNYDSALLALDQAVKKDYNDATTELASYNYAVASARGGKVPFGSSVAQFENFLQRYPNSTLAPSVADYVINGYISDNNYGAALTAINKIKNPSDKILAAKQKVLLMYGARQLQAGRTDDAVSSLTEARSLGRYSGAIASESSLWLGEALYKKGNYSEAVKSYKNFLNETPSSNSNHSLALYDMAYAQFALKDFTQSKDYFNRYLKSLNSSTPSDVADLKADAYNRVGDCYYYASDFTSAESNYEKAIAEAPSAADYPMYQKALMKGLMRDHQGKIDGLASMMNRFPSSALIPSALLETGESYTELNNNSKAISTYKTLSERYPSTPQGRQGALLLAIAQLNAGNTENAITSYKHVISTYPTSDEARAAADDLKHIYADRGEITEYTRFLASVPDAPKLEQSEIAGLQLEGVEKAYEAGREVDAARQAEELIASYPDSSEAVEALGILAKVREKQGKPAEALAAYRQLAEKSSNEIDVNNARMGILRLSRDLGSDEAVLETSAQLLESSSLGSDDRNEVMLAKALALRNTGKSAEANKILTTLAANPSTLPGAKASYYLAQGLYDSNDLSGALKQVNSLIDSNTPHEYWLARGFILLSDIKRRQGDTFEANEYLRSLRDNYPGEEADIFQMINTRLSN
jgi:TolA-binding protein